MRLFNVYSHRFQEFHGYRNRPPYVITSHRWLNENEEPSYVDVKENTMRQGRGWQKIEGFCNIVKEHFANVDGCRIEWIWIDTICIDKRSLPEVSTAINSMFRFYSEAYCCLAYLKDVSILNVTQFQASEWFKRSWTLQELVAPRTVLFLAKEWTTIGYKGQISADMASFAGSDLTDLVQYVTTIPKDVLQHPALVKIVSDDEKWRWAKGRAATREEDQAYALLGLFDVFLSPIYGQGLPKAIKQLQKAVYDDKWTPEKQVSLGIVQRMEINSNGNSHYTQGRDASFQDANLLQEAKSAQDAFTRLRGEGESPEQAIETLARALQRSNNSLTREQAITGVRGRLTYRLGSPGSDVCFSDRM